MKRLILAGAAALALASAQPAIAADLPIKAPAPAVVLFNWTGFYIGAHAGYAWSDTDWFVPNSPLNIAAGGCIIPGCNFSVGAHSANSWLAGGQIGFNHQIGSFVWGVEAQASWVDLHGSNPQPLFPILIDHTKTNWIATLAARFGYAWDRVLVYGKVGGAWAHDTYWTRFLPVAVLVSQQAIDTRTGWMGGIGLEYAFMPNWSLKFEYDYLWFGRRRETLQAQPGCACVAFQYDIKQTIQLVKVGVNYRFGGPF